MNADEIVNRLREYAKHCDGVHSCWNDTTLISAADLIESLQAQLEQKTNEAEGMRSNWYKCIENLKESQRRERAAVEDMKRIVDAVREAYCDETCCFACKFDCDTSITWTGDHACECPGFERDDCFEWRGPIEDGKGE